MRLPTLFIIVAGTMLLSLPHDGDACAVIERSSRSEDHVRIAEESAVIVWHAATKTQHFIRRATFDTKAPDFGFLVPTPTQPALAEVGDTAFSFLEQVIRPRLVHESGGIEFQPALCCFLSYFRMSATLNGGLAPDSVRVLDSQRVGGFDAVVLEADDAHALNDWLKQHGYPSNPELVSWLGLYVSARWKITAFKIARGGKADGQLQTSAVRMSFNTDRPFFPYREPSENTDRKDAAAWHGPRMLRVFFLGDARMAGKRGAGDWAAQVPWADRLDDGQRDRLILELGVPGDHLSPGTWLTTFEDTSSPRPGADDLSFEPAPHQNAVRPPDIVQRGRPLWIPIDAALLAIALAAYVLALVYLKRRRARAARAE